MESTKGPKAEFTKDGKLIDPKWWEQEYTMNSMFCQFKDGQIIARFTLDELLDTFAPEGSQFNPLIEPIAPSSDQIV